MLEEAAADADAVAGSEEVWDSCLVSSGSLRRHAKAAQEFRFVEYFDTQLLCLVQLASGLFTGHEKAGLLASPLPATLPPACSISSVAFARLRVGSVPGEDDALPIEWPIAEPPPAAR